MGTVAGSATAATETTMGTVAGSATALGRESSFDAPVQQSGVSGSPITTGAKDKVSPYWLNLQFEDTLCIPEAIFENNQTENQTHGTL